MTNLKMEMRLRDQFGQTVAVVVEELPHDVAFMGERVAEETALGIFAPSEGQTAWDATVQRLQVREFRRKALEEFARRQGQRLADFLEDREGWHGLDRQDGTRRRAAED